MTRRSLVPDLQRSLRAPRPGRRVERARPTPEHQARLAARLTSRDRWLTRLIAEHRVLTSAQIAHAAFPSPHAANVRLRELYQWRVLNRFQPYTDHGNAHHHYILDTAGHTLLAHEDGITPKDLRWTPDQALAVAHSLRLAHTIAVNGVFTALIHTARTRGGRLTAWWSEDRCGRLFGAHIRPDGYGRWTDHPGGLEVEFFLEHDQGSEQLSRVAGKLAGYAALAAATGISTPVLFRFRTTGRETTARPALAAALARLHRPDTVPVATTAADQAPAADGDHGPAGPVWLPLHPHTQAGAGRLRLAHLPARAWPHLPTPTPAGPPAELPTTPAVRRRLTPPAPMPPPQPAHRG
jgi:hypothetical protein